MLLFRHGAALTLSIIHRRPSRKDEVQDVLDKVTLIKDIGIQQPNRAQLEILADLALTELYQAHPFSNFLELHQAWQDTLNISTLNKRFYAELANWYFWAVGTVRFPSGAGTDEKARNAINVIRMITRLIFVWFIREKGLVKDDLFDRRKLEGIVRFGKPDETVYYKAVLQNLFFATLNTEMNKDTPDAPGRIFAEDARVVGDYLVSNKYRYRELFKNSAAFLALCAEIPFLNGGLFECLDREVSADELESDPDLQKRIVREGSYTVLRVDGFSRRKENPLVVPDFLFFAEEQALDLNETYGTSGKHYKVRGLLHLLSHYKFTVEENTPIEEEVALDPELLGKVFENLLAAYNPETGATARKQTGSFYTPREIVNYMVDEALLAHLENALTPGPSPASGRGETADRLRRLLAYAETPLDFSEEEIQRLIGAIESLKSLDPACGSGAFPMGLLHKLVYLLQRLDPDNRRWRELQRQKAIHETEAAYIIGNQAECHTRLQDIEDAFTHNTSDYGRKLYLIENCIYGVDIQPVAVQIAKLRFFISLVVEQKLDDTKPNRGIRPLPNLETKFVAANTLVGIEKPGQQGMFRNPQVVKVEQELSSVRHKLFSAGKSALKRQYRQEDERLRKQLAGLLKQEGWGDKAAAQLAKWNPYDQNIYAGFFDPGWMFGLTDGFDVVIGNPPYLESRHPAFNDSLKNSYQASTKIRWGDDAKYITKGSDLLIYFFEDAIYSIKNSGCVVLITQNSWLDTEYGKKFQTFLLKNTRVRKIIDSDFRYFQSGEGPNINAIITLFIGKKTSGSNVISFARYHENFQWLSIANLNLTGQQDDTVVAIQNYQYSDTILHELKWGILLSSSNDILQLFKLLNKRAKRLEEIRSSDLSLGQGLNLTKDYFVTGETLSSLGFAEKAAIPIHTSSDGAIFDIRKTTQFLLDKSKLSKQETIELRSRGITAFDPKSTNKKPPKLIMPRGIGSRYYCAMNSNGCYSSSGVDIYDNSGTAPEGLVLNLWLFLNSSIAWLLREISGRKNLGGGMLKAEAVDLEAIPVYMDFGKSKEIKAIFMKIKDRQAMATIEEIDTDEHNQIDQIVFDYLDLTDDQRRNILLTLKTKVAEREKKSTT